MKSMFNADTYCRLLTFAVFVLAGFDLSRNVPKSRVRYPLIVVVLIVAAAIYLATGGGTVHMIGFEIYVNELVLGLSTGLVVGTVYRARPRFKIRS